MCVFAFGFVLQGRCVSLFRLSSAAFTLCFFLPNPSFVRLRPSLTFLRCPPIPYTVLPSFPFRSASDRTFLFLLMGAAMLDPKNPHVECAPFPLLSIPHLPTSPSILPRSCLGQTLSPARSIPPALPSPLDPLLLKVPRFRLDPLFTGIRHPGVTPGKSLTNEALSKPGLEPRSNRTDTQFVEGNVFPLIIDSLPSKVCIADEKGIRDEGQTEGTNVRRCDGWNGDSKAKEEAIDTGARKRRLHGVSGGLWCVTQLELRSDGQLLRERWSSKGSMWSSRKNLPSLCRFLLRDRASTNGRFRERFRRKMRCRSAV